MMMIPGFLISFLSFPGVIVHESAHMLFCRMRKVPVFDVRFFQFDAKTVGYVIHGKTDNFTTTLLISAGPFFVNTVLCLVVMLPAFLPVYMFDAYNPVTCLLMWLGISIGMHAFPSVQDADCIMREAKSEIRKLNPLAIASIPVVILIYIANALSMVWFDFIYGVLIGIGVPSLLFNALMK